MAAVFIMIRFSPVITTGRSRFTGIQDGIFILASIMAGDIMIRSSHGTGLTTVTIHTTDIRLTSHIMVIGDSGTQGPITDIPSSQVQDQHVR